MWELESKVELELEGEQGKVLQRSQGENLESMWEPESIQRAVANSSKISGGAGVYGLWAKQKVGYSSGQEINEGRHTLYIVNKTNHLI